MTWGRFREKAIIKLFSNYNMTFSLEIDSTLNLNDYLPSCHSSNGSLINAATASGWTRTARPMRTAGSRSSRINRHTVRQLTFKIRATSRAVSSGSIEVWGDFGPDMKIALSVTYSCEAKS